MADMTATRLRTYRIYGELGGSAYDVLIEAPSAEEAEQQAFDDLEMAGFHHPEDLDIWGIEPRL